MIKNKTQLNKGFVLLYAVVVSSIILAIALGVMNIALKEINFTTSARDTNDAFFAADTGAECALFFNKGKIVTDPFPDFVNCNGEDVEPVVDSFGNTLYIIPNLGSSGNSCATFSITKDATSGQTVIKSIGRSNCDSNNYVERQLEVTY